MCVYLLLVGLAYTAVEGPKYGTNWGKTSGTYYVYI